MNWDQIEGKDEADRQVDEFSGTYGSEETTTREKIRSAGR
jgi:hypothetical protein